MKKSLIFLALPLAFSLARCDCGTDLTEVPSPDIQLEDPAGAVNDDGDLAFSFADLTPGQTESQKIKVRNTGTAQLIIDSYGLRSDLQDPRCMSPSSEFEIQPPAGPLNPGDEVSLSIVYAPRDGGEDCAVLQILSNDPDEAELRVYLNGKGAAAKLCASAAQLDFGEVPIHTQATQTLELTNCGTKELTLQALTQQQGFPPFAFESEPATPYGPMQPGDSLSLTFTFESDVPGDFNDPSSSAGLVQIDSMGPINPQSFIVLTAEAITPPTCDLQVVPTSLQFGHVRPGDDRSYDISVNNQGRLDCEIQSMEQVDGSGDFTITHGDAPPARTLAPGASEVLTFKFAPTSSAVLNATFRLTSDDPDEPQIDIHLEGDGTTPSGCVIEPDPTSLNFGSRSTTQISELNVDLVNIGDENCMVNDTSITAGAPDFFVGEVGFPIIGAIVNSGQSLTVPVGFQPRSDGLHNGILTVGYKEMGFGNPAMTAQVDLMGTGAAPQICIDPVELDFGQVVSGAPCADIAVSNCGGTELNIRGVVMQAGSSQDFEMTAPSGLPGALQPGQSVNVHVCYRPDGPGADFGAVEIISDDPDDNTSRVVLRGNSAGMCPPFLSCAPSPLDMGEIASDTTAIRSIVCTNYGSEIITISDVTMDNEPIFSVSSQTPAILSPGEQLVVQVGFGPGYVGAFTGRVSVNSNACDSTIEIDVSAAGVEPDLPPCIPPQNFSPQTLWTWDHSNIESEATQVWVTPLVANMNDDNLDGLVDVNDIPDVIFSSFDGADFRSNTDMQNDNGDHMNDPIPGYLRIVSGDDGRELVSVGGEEYAVDSEANMAIADIDGDNLPEIVAVKWLVLPGTEAMSDGPKLNGKFKYGYLIAFENDGTFKWQSEQWIGNEDAMEDSGAVSIADVDHDGFPEILYGNNLFDHNGHLLWTGSAGRADSGHGPQSFAINLDAQGDLEIVCGRTVYRSDGSIMWDRDDLYDGNPIVVDMNGDGQPELVLRNDKLHFLNALTGATIAGPYVIPNPNPPDEGGDTGVIPTIPAAADFDNDGLPEVVVANESALVVYEMDGTILWQQEIYDGTGMAGPSAFDFEGDGIYEVVYADENHAFAYRGSDGQQIYQADRASLTISEIATVADINDDGQAEMVVVFNEPLLESSKGVKAFTNSEGAWVGTLRIYNQQAYHVTNIDESGIVPRDEPPHWLQGVDQNSFHANIPRCAP